LGRIGTTSLVLALLGGTAAAFAVAEHLKLEKPPITRTRVDKVFSPVCGCETSRAAIAFTLRRADRVEVWIVHGGERVATLAEGTRRYPRGRVELAWDGRDEDGRLVPDGRYRPVVRLRDAERTISLPNPIRVDTRRPRVALLSLEPREFSPDGDGRRDRVVVAYRLDERARPFLLVDGRRRVLGRFRRPEGRLEWYGREQGRPLAPGTYRLSLSAQDAAGNLARPTRPVRVRIRYVELPAGTLRARPGATIRVAVSTDARQLRYRVGAVSARARVVRGTLAVRAPARPGRYRLLVIAPGGEARGTLLVRR
jgi:hypothetical protein